jgi:ribosomal-protein-alanine N-acetyltransferase
MERRRGGPGDAARTGAGDAPPVLLTDRLRLRPFTAADAAAVRRLAGDFAVADTTLSIPHPYDEGVAEGWVASLPAAFAEGRQAVFGITDRTTGELLGAIGLVLRREHDRAELGYWIGRPLWGRGLATEAARAVLEYGFRTLGLHRIHACHFARNPASGRVLAKIGMHLEGTARAHVMRWGQYEDLVQYGILREEFETP